MTNIKLVSIVIPCRNEERYICGCLDSIIANDFSKDWLEVLVVDGMSEDGTRDIVQRYTQRYPFIKLLDNPGKTTPMALNIGIKNAQGDIIVRMDAHSSYPPHFIATCVKYLKEMPIDVVGGPVITTPRTNTLIANSIAFVTSHPFGVGNSKFRTSTQEGYVDTVPFGAYRRTVFDNIGLFNEQLVRNQDNELSSRIINSGGKIYFTPELKAFYYNQATVSGLLKQAAKTGMWNVLTIQINPSAFRWRHFIPFFFVTALLLSIFMTISYNGSRTFFFSLIIPYSIVAVLSSFQIAFRQGLRYIWVLPILFILYHTSYGLGTWMGLLKVFLNVIKVGYNNAASGKKKGEDYEGSTNSRKIF